MWIRIPLCFGTRADQISSFSRTGKGDVLRRGSGNSMPEQGSSDYGQTQGSETLFSSKRDFKVITAIWNFLFNLKHKAFYFVQV